MAYNKSSATGMNLFEDDHTPIAWTIHHHHAWACGHIAAENGLHDSPFAPASPFDVCWQAGHACCEQTGNRTGAGRKRKTTRPDFLIEQNGLTVGVVGSRRELVALGVPLLPNDGQPHQTVPARSVAILLPAFVTKEGAEFPQPREPL